MEGLLGSSVREPRRQKHEPISQHPEGACRIVFVGIKKKAKSHREISNKVFVCLCHWEPANFLRPS